MDTQERHDVMAPPGGAAAIDAEWVRAALSAPHVLDATRLIARALSTHIVQEHDHGLI